MIWISEADVTALLDMEAAIGAVERALIDQARGAALDMLKTHVAWGGGHTLHAIGAASPSAGLAATKTWAHTAGGAAPLLILFDARDGSVRAILQAFALGQLRTGAVSGVATRWLARGDADALALIGTGRQARTQVEAVACVRRLRHVRVFSPDGERRGRFARDLASWFDGTVSETASVAEAVEGAPIVTLATRARAPFLSAPMVARGSHVNAIGAITPERAEVTDDLLARCAPIVVDSTAAARNLSRELIDYFDRSGRSWDDAVPLCRIVAERRNRPAGADVTLFKAMGMGLCDLAVGIEVYQRATRAGYGRILE